MRLLREKKLSLIKSNPDKLTDLRPENNSKERLKFYFIKWKNFKNNNKWEFSRKNNNKPKLINKLLSAIKMQCSLSNRENKNKEKKMKKLPHIWEKKLKSKLKSPNNKDVLKIKKKKKSKGWDNYNKKPPIDKLSLML